VAIATEFLLATSEVYSPMASVAIFIANTVKGSHEYKLLLMEEGGVRLIKISVFCPCPAATFRDN
jgi:hypothetical protein